jgi:hypothetical protein
MRRQFPLALAALLALIVIASPSPARAVCSGPAGNAGTLIYNSVHSVLQYCDDTKATLNKAPIFGVQ